MKSIWDRLLGKGTTSAAAAANDGGDEADLLDDVRDQVRRDVAAAFEPPEVILESAIDVFAGEIDAARLEAHARRCLDEELAAHAEAQAQWPAPTDCERLDAAFAALERQGVVTRQNFSCCGSCGALEIRTEMKNEEARGARVSGYAFYHAQDTESAVHGYGLCLNYGAREDGKAAALAVGRQICEELERHGLTADWNGSWDRRIEVPIDWKRRREAAAPTAT